MVRRARISSLKGPPGMGHFAVEMSVVITNPAPERTLLADLLKMAKIREPASGPLAISGCIRTILIRRLLQANRAAEAVGWRMTDAAVERTENQAPVNAYERRLCRLAFLAQQLNDRSRTPAVSITPSSTRIHRMDLGLAITLAAVAAGGWLILCR